MQVGDLDLHRILQVFDGNVPDAARHHVAVQRQAVLLRLGRQTEGNRSSPSGSTHKTYRSLFFSHLEQAGAAEEHEVDPGQRPPVHVTQRDAGQQRARQRHLSQRVSR